MTPDEFVKGFYIEHKSLIEEYFKADSNSDVASMILRLELDEKRTNILREIVSGLLRDAFYTILFGIDGEVNIGGKQVSYKLFDEENNELTGGEIEAAAWDYFHGSKM